MSRLSSHHFWFSAGENVPSSCLLVTKSSPPSGGGAQNNTGPLGFQKWSSPSLFSEPPRGGTGFLPFFQGSELARKGPSVPLRVPSEPRVFASPAWNSGACGLGPLGAHSGLTRDSRRVGLYLAHSFSNSSRCPQEGLHEATYSSLKRGSSRPK